MRNIIVTDKEYAEIGREVSKAIANKSDEGIGRFYQRVASGYNVGDIIADKDFYYSESKDKDLMLGYAVSLMAVSVYHRYRPITEYFEINISPFMEHGQIIFVLNRGPVIGMATWVSLSDKDISDVINGGEIKNTNSGDNIFMNDFLAPYGKVVRMVFNGGRVLFKGADAKSTKRSFGGGVIGVRGFRF